MTAPNPNSLSLSTEYDADLIADEPSASTRLRSASPLVIEEDEGLTSFFQREAHGLDVPLDASSSSFSAVDPILRSSYDHDDPDSPVLAAKAAETHPIHLTPFIALLTMTACISGLLFGYDTGVISSTLVSIGSDLGGTELSTLAQSLITSSTSLFALLASPPAGWLADVCGRRWVIIVADLLFVAGALIQSLSSSVPLMVIGRSVVGAGVGAASLVVPLYISELAPPAFRGRLVVVNSLFITGGQMVAYVLGWWLASLPHGWRWMVGLGAAPALAQLGLLALMPETPRWLIKVGRVEPARAILNRVYGTGAERVVDALVRAVEREILEEDELRHQQRSLQAQSRIRKSKDESGVGAILSWRPDGWAELFSVGGHRRALAIACMLQALQQLCGFNSLMYFSATIFRSVGFGSPILASLSVAVTNFLFTVVSMFSIDRLGRRRILLVTVPFMVVALLLTAVAFRFMQNETLSASTAAAASVAGRALTTLSRTIINSTSTITGTISTSADRTWPAVVLASVILYVAFYAMGLGSVPWQQSELFPLAVRSLGCGISTATNWGSNFVVGLTFLPMMQLLTPSFTFVLYAGVCVVGWMLVYAIYPETKGLGLEEVGGLLRDGWGVEESLRRRRDGRRERR